MMLRLFVALALPDVLRDALSARASGLPHAKWVPPENYHLTLRFIGEVEPWRAEEVDQSLAALRGRPFDLTLAGAGLFEKAGKVSSVWIGGGAQRGTGGAAGEDRNRGCSGSACRRNGGASPHVTLARTERAAPGNA